MQTQSKKSTVGLAALFFILTAVSILLYSGLNIFSLFVNFFELVIYLAQYADFVNYLILEIISLTLSLLCYIPNLILAVACLIEAVALLKKKEGKFQIVSSAIFLFAAAINFINTLLPQNFILIVAAALALFLSIATAMNSNGLKKAAKIVKIILLVTLGIYLVVSLVWMAITVFLAIFSYVTTIIDMIQSFQYAHNTNATNIIFTVLYGIIDIFLQNINLLSTLFSIIATITIGVSLALKPATSNQPAETEEMEVVEEPVEEVEEVAHTEEEVEEVAYTEEDVEE